MMPTTVAILALADTLPGGRAALLDDLRAMILDDRLYSPDQVAEMWSVSLACVRHWAACGELVPSIKVGNGTVRYTRQDIDNFKLKNSAGRKGDAGK